MCNLIPESLHFYYFQKLILIQHPINANWDWICFFVRHFIPHTYIKLTVIYKIDKNKRTRGSETMQCLEYRRFSLLCLWIFLFKCVNERYVSFFTSIDPLCHYYCCNRNILCLKSQGCHSKFLNKNTDQWT